MKFNMYAMKDSLIGFGRPHVGINDEAEIRDFNNAMRDDMNSEFKSLYRIGEFNDLTGQIDALEEPIKLVEGKPWEKQK